jgi:hypothetical protein
MTDQTLISPADETDWSMVIQPQRGLLDLRLSELWRYRDLRDLSLIDIAHQR